MIQCAHVAAIHDPGMKEYYERVRKAHPHPVAITHVANKMLTIICHMLTQKALVNLGDPCKSLFKKWVRLD